MQSCSWTFIPALINWKMSVHLRRKETTHSTNTLYGGVNIINPVTSASGQYHASQKISEPLKDINVQKNESFIKTTTTCNPKQICDGISMQATGNRESGSTLEIRESLSPPKQRTMDLLCKNIIVVVSFTTTRSRLQFKQRRISWCAQSTIWLEAAKCTISL